MATKDGVTNRNADDETLSADADPQNILESLTAGGYLCSDPIIFPVLLTRLAHGITSIIQKRLDKLRVI